MDKSTLIKDMTEEEVEKHLGPLLKRFGKRVKLAFELLEDIKSETGKVSIRDAEELLYVIRDFNKTVRSKNDVWFSHSEFDEKNIEEISSLLQENEEC